MTLRFIRIQPVRYPDDTKTPISPTLSAIEGLLNMKQARNLADDNLFCGLRVNCSGRWYKEIIKPIASSGTFSVDSFRIENMKTFGNKPEVTVSPRGHLLVDDELHIRVQGLDSGQEVTIHTGINVSGKTMDSCCQFRADGSGVVDLYNHPSLAGSYTGISPMGIFWSMVPTPDMPKGFRLMVKNINKPITTRVSVYPGNHTADDIRIKQPTPMVTQVIERWYKGQGVTSVKVTHGRLRGTLFLPPGPGPFPGLIDLFGTAGGLNEFRASLLASRGIASFALAYFMYPDLPDSPIDLDLDYFLEAVDWLLNQPQVYGEGLGVVGVSMGAIIASLMAAHCPQVRAIVNISGGCVNVNAPMKYSKGLIPCLLMDISKATIVDGAMSLRGAVRDVFDETDLIPIWRHNPRVLSVVGWDDTCCMLEVMQLMKKHYPKDKQSNFTLLSYPGAGHLLEPPYTPSCSRAYHKAFGRIVLWGGQPKPHADAQEDAWRKMLKFLHTHVPKTKTQCCKL